MNRDQIITADTLRAMTVPFVLIQPMTVETLVAPPRAHRPTPGCDEGGPHRYAPPGQERNPTCSLCGTTPAAAAVAGLHRIAIEEAWQTAGPSSWTKSESYR